jgi:hypothetical protein
MLEFVRGSYFIAFLKGTLMVHLTKLYVFTIFNIFNEFFSTLLKFPKVHRHF